MIGDIMGREVGELLIMLSNAGSVSMVRRWLRGVGERGERCRDADALQKSAMKCKHGREEAEECLGSVKCVIYISSCVTL